MHAAARHSVKHDKYKHVYFVPHDGELHIFALNGHRLATVAIKAPTITGDCLVLSIEDCLQVIKQFAGNAGALCLIPMGNQLMLSDGVGVLTVFPIEEKFTYSQFAMCAKSYGGNTDTTYNLDVQYVHDIYKSCEALGIEVIQFNSGTTSQPVTFSHESEDFKFKFVCMTRREK